MAEKLEFDLKVGVNELQKALSDATTGSKKLGDTISTALGTFAGQAALKGFNLLGDAIGNVGGFLKDSVKAAQEQENALNRLSQALRSTGEFSQQAVEDFSDFASQLQKTSVFGDEVVIGQIAIAKSFGATNEQAKALVQAAANLAAVLGGSLEENVMKLGKTLNGVVSRELKGLVPELQSLSKEAISTGGAIDLINQRFGGAAAAELDTYAGKTTSLANAFSDLQEEIGAFITGSETIGSIISIGTGLIQELTQGIVDYKTEQKRANGTLVETEGSLNSLSEKYSKVRDEIEKYQAVIDADKQKGLLDSLFTFDNAPLARERVQSLTVELAKLDAQIAKASEQLKTVEAQGQKTKTVAPTDQELKQIAQVEAQKTQLIAQAELERQTIQQQIANESLLNDFAKQEAEIQRLAEFETQKAELAFQFAEQKAETLGNQALIEAEKARIGKERELEFTKIGNKQILAEEQLRIKKSQDSIAFFKKYEDQTNKERIGNLQSTFSTIATLSSSSNKTIAAIGKAAAISTATIDGYVAINKALASAPPPANYALAAAVGAATAANVAKIAGVQGLATGGVVGATMGPDNRMATVRDGEMILNAEQQEKLFNMINAGGSGGDIVVQVDGREVARAVRSQVQQGFRLA
jgi:hypothetical protein